MSSLHKNIPVFQVEEMNTPVDVTQLQLVRCQNPWPENKKNSWGWQLRWRDEARREQRQREARINAYGYLRTCAAVQPVSRPVQMIPPECWPLIKQSINCCCLTPFAAPTSVTWPANPITSHPNTRGCHSLPASAAVWTRPPLMRCQGDARTRVFLAAINWEPLDRENKKLLPDTDSTCRLLAMGQFSCCPLQCLHWANIWRLHQLWF